MPLRRGSTNFHGCRRDYLSGPDAPPIGPVGFVADDRQVASQQIDELRQLVDAGVVQERSDSRPPRSRARTLGATSSEI